MNIALLYTPDTDDADEALCQANHLAEGLASEGENVSVLGEAEGDWLMGGTADEATVLLDALRMFVDAHSEGDEDAYNTASRMVDELERQGV